jgi:sulfite reductase alpha subunit-like flavoprotein
VSNAFRPSRHLESAGRTGPKRRAKKKKQWSRCVPTCPHGIRSLVISHYTLTLNFTMPPMPLMPHMPHVIQAFPAGKLSIYFGSQTGTSEGFARSLSEEGRKAGFDCKIIDLEDFDAEVLINSEKAIFLMATYGEGKRPMCIQAYKHTVIQSYNHTIIQSLKRIGCVEYV